MLTFQASLHARSPEVSSGIALDLRGRRTPTLIVPVKALAHPFPVSFEQALDKLATFERLFAEPDGSFVWVSSSDAESRWQLEGNLFDRNGRLLVVDLQGSCSEQELDRLLASLGWPEAAVMFELTREAVFLDEAGFRKYASLEP